MFLPQHGNIRRQVGVRSSCSLRRQSDIYTTVSPLRHPCLALHDSFGRKQKLLQARGDSVASNARVPARYQQQQSGVRVTLLPPTCSSLFKEQTSSLTSLGMGVGRPLYERRDGTRSRKCRLVIGSNGFGGAYQVSFTRNTHIRSGVQYLSLYEEGGVSVWGEDKVRIKFRVVLNYNNPYSITF